jgi:hypothetical protein
VIDVAELDKISIRYQAVEGGIGPESAQTPTLGIDPSLEKP